MTTNANWIDNLRDQRGVDLSLSQAEAIQKMIVDGDLMHIDGGFVAALADMADKGHGEYCGCRIALRRLANQQRDWIIRKDGRWTTEDSAISALVTAEQSEERGRIIHWREEAPDAEAAPLETEEA